MKKWLSLFGIEGELPENIGPGSPGDGRVVPLPLGPGFGLETGGQVQQESRFTCGRGKWHDHRYDPEEEVNGGQATALSGKGAMDSPAPFLRTQSLLMNPRKFS